MTKFSTSTITDPLDLEVEPGFRVRDLASKDECDAAVLQIDMAIERILAQIGHAEASEEPSPPGWRTRAQSAIRWKKRVRQTVVTYAKTMEPKRPPSERRRQVILDTIRSEIGDDEFERLLAIAKRRHPEAFAMETSS
ncbi:MAG: hypothetical protein ACTHJ3_05115 [Pararhizobium sp.]